MAGDFRVRKKPISAIYEQVPSPPESPPRPSRHSLPASSPDRTGDNSGSHLSPLGVLRWPSDISRFRRSAEITTTSPVSSESVRDGDRPSTRERWSHSVNVSPLSSVRYSSTRPVALSRHDGARLTPDAINRQENSHNAPDEETSLTAESPQTPDEEPSPEAARLGQFTEKLEPTAPNISAHENSFPIAPEEQLPAAHDPGPNLRNNRMWNSNWLRKGVLIGFSSTYIIIFIIVMALYGSSNSDQGIASRSWASHSGWTLAPTLIFVAITALWRQVDLDCRILSPWMELRRASSPAARNVLLDYISPALPRTLFIAAKNHHWGAVLSISSTILLLFSTIISTGLFVLEPTRTWDTDGEVFDTVRRLHVKRLSVGLMGTALLLLSIASALLIVFRPRDSVSRNPNSIAAVATLLSSSSLFRSRLMGLSPTAPKIFEEEISLDRYKTRIHDGNVPIFEVYPLKRPLGVNTKARSQGGMQWWRPSAFTAPFMVITILLPIVLLAVLEGIQTVNNRNDGLLDAQLMGEAHVFATYFPTLVMIIVLVLFVNVDFGVSVTAPFLALIDGNATPKSSILVNLIESVSVSGLFSACKARHLPHALSIISVFLASWLVIISAGLYSPRETTTYVTSDVSLQPADRLVIDLNGKVSLDDMGAGQTTSQLLQDKATYPQWTYGNLVFPRLELLPNTTASTDVAIIRVPATRSSLNCTVVPREDLNVNVNSFSSGRDVATTITVNTTLPRMCEFDSSLDSATWIQEVFLNLERGDNEMYFGHADQMSWEKDGSVISTGMNLDMSYPPSYGCPSFALTLGKVDFRWTGSRPVNGGMENLSVAVCYQNIETVMTEVAFNLTSLEIDSKIPPKPLEETVERLTSSTRPPSENFGYPVSSLLNALDPSNHTISVPGTDPLSPFLRALEWRTGGSPIDSLMGADHVEDLIESANEVFSLFVAQLLNSNGRVPLDAQRSKRLIGDAHNLTLLQRAAPDQIIHAASTISSHSRLRFVQNPGPKIALQVLLGMLSLLAIAIHVLTFRKVQKLLPRPPTSIAGLASLLAESEMVSRRLIPPGSEWHENPNPGARATKERALDTLFEGHVFSIGWWDTSISGKKDGNVAKNETTAIQNNGVPHINVNGESTRPNWISAVTSRLHTPVLPNIRPVSGFSSMRSRNSKKSRSTNKSKRDSKAVGSGVLASLLHTTERHDHTDQERIPDPDEQVATPTATPNNPQPPSVPPLPRPRHQRALSASLALSSHPVQSIDNTSNPDESASAATPKVDVTAPTKSNSSQPNPSQPRPTRPSLSAPPTSANIPLDPSLRPTIQTRLSTPAQSPTNEPTFLRPSMSPDLFHRHPSLAPPVPDSTPLPTPITPPPPPPIPKSTPPQTRPDSHASATALPPMPSSPDLPPLPPQRRRSILEAQRGLNLITNLAPAASKSRPKNRRHVSNFSVLSSLGPGISRRYGIDIGTALKDEGVKVRLVGAADGEV